MTDRLDAHYDLSTTLALKSDRDVSRLFANAEASHGWGVHHTIDLDGHKVFVKRIPLSDREVNNAYSTRNLFRMPVWYSYGVGSGGFGAFRELAVHVKTTNWVRARKCKTFPLLHHHRILPAKSHGPVEESKLDDYVRFWNGSRSIRNFMRERATPRHQLVLFMEHLPPFENFIVEHPEKLLSMLGKAIRTVDYLAGNGVIHFDAHTANWLTDGKDVFLTDFGLVLDEEFDLTAREREFFEHHRYYDYGQVVSSIGVNCLLSYFALDQQGKAAVHQELGTQPGRDFRPFMYEFVPRALSLDAKGLVRLPPEQRKHIRKYGKIVSTQNAFFKALLGPRKNAVPYPREQMERCLRDAGVIG